MEARGQQFRKADDEAMSKRTVIDMEANLDRLDSKSVHSSVILHNPVSESTSINRRRTFSLAAIRADYRDAQTQLVVLLTQLHDENFTGQLTFHLSSGRVCNVETTQSEKINNKLE